MFWRGEREDHEAEDDARVRAEDALELMLQEQDRNEDQRTEEPVAEPEKDAFTCRACLKIRYPQSDAVSSWVAIATSQKGIDILRHTQLFLLVHLKSS